MKNVCAKHRDVNTPYAVYESASGNFQYRVLKKYQANDEAKYARWLVACKSPATGGGYEMGDMYVENVKYGCGLVWRDIPGEPRHSAVAGDKLETW